MGGGCGIEMIVWEGLILWSLRSRLIELEFDVKAGFSYRRSLSSLIDGFWVYQKGRLGERYYERCLAPRL